VAQASIVSGVAERYASALFELARDENAIDAVASDIAAVERLIAESDDFQRLLRSPVFSADDQLNAVTAILQRAGIAGILTNFVKLVARNRRLFALEGMIRSFRDKVAAHRGEATADVVSAQALGDAEIADLKAALKSVTGKDVSINATVDPSLIGGLVVKVGSRMIDTSLKTKLASLKTALKEVR
jgi:F-type H+-transporting ATPase subunit delta